MMKKIVKYAHYLHRKGFTAGNAGNISVLYRNKIMDVVAITSSGSCLGTITEDEIVLLDLDGNVISGKKPSSELHLHMNLYKIRDDINAIVHTHPPYTVALTMKDIRIERPEGVPGNKKFLEEIPYYRPGSIELANACSKKLKKEKILVLKKHGLVTCGSSLEEAVNLTELVENAAKITYISSQ